VRPFRFGVQLSQPLPGGTWAGAARRAEDLGYSSLFMPDHFGDQYAPIPALMAAADATTSLRVGSLVLDVDFKHPVVLAKEAATLDVLSGGRLELGIGAGWMNTDYEQSGIQHDPAGVRVDRLAEAITVLTSLWADEPCTFEGAHYRIAGLDGRPKPAQRPRPPILVGGGGKRVLSLAAREADIVGINPKLSSGAIDAGTVRDGVGALTDRKVAWVREAAGDRFPDLELNMLIFAVVITDDAAATAANLGSAFGLDPSEVGDFGLAWVGTVDEICETLQARRERWGVSYLVVQGAAMETAAPIVARLTGT
jgi:probable F420-dependent oxidoreductase